MNKPNFTVVIPLYNKAKHILRTLQSITWQKYPAMEIVVVDDGSTDEGPSLVEKANISNLRLIRQKNKGVSAARNRGIAEARYEYVAFLDADDEWLPLYLDEISGLITKFPQADFYGTSYQIVEADERYIDAKIHPFTDDPRGVLIDDYFDIASRGDLPFTMSSITIKRNLFSKIGGFPEGEPIGEDQDLFCRAAMATRIAYSINIHSLYHKDAQNQASKINVPETECPFSARVTSNAIKFVVNNAEKQSMLRYSAAHLCHLAKLNILSHRFTQARNLLADPRCKLKPKHLLALYIYSWIKQVQRWKTSI
jgi:glycosyltransferase involved in cell wall biosynthesis